MNLIDGIAQSIATMEGFFKPNSLAARNNNPGNLRSWGSVPVVDGYASFPTAEQGWAALRAQIQRNIDRGLTLREFFSGKPGVYAGYAPSADNNHPEEYAKFVASRLGVDVDTPLPQIISGSIPKAQSPAAGSAGPELTPLDLAAVVVIAVSLLSLMLD